MPSLVKQFTFVSATTINPSQVNANFDDIVAFLNNDVIHKDGSRAMTANLELAATDPVSANQAARKSYVDAREAAAVSSANGTNIPRTHVKWGRHDGTINGAGDTVFAHGLGAVPTSVVLTGTAAGANFYNFDIQAIDSVNVNVRTYDSRTGLVVTSGTIAFYWMAAKAL